jgi:hypothetical protein
MPRRTLFVLLVLLCLPTCAGAQPWNGILDASRAADWSNAGIPGGIPNRTTICATLHPGATAAQINAAIAACPANQVVFLNAGTYNLAAGIDFANRSNVTLRGAGPDQTFLNFTGGVGCHGLQADICIGNAETNWQGGPIHIANWTAGYGKGATQITLSSTTGIKPGSTLLVLDQLNDASDTGTIFVCEARNLCAKEGPSGNGRTNRTQQQLVLATAVSGNTVTISPGLYMPNWRAGQSPGAWWGDTVITNVGLEDLSLDHTNSLGLQGVGMFNAYRSWIRNVRSITPNRNHVWLSIAARIVVRDSYFYGTQNARSQSYGVEAFISSDVLVENNIFQHIVSPNMMNGSAGGSVYAHNFATDMAYIPATWMQPAHMLHSGGVDMVLFEGNQSNQFEGDDIHGTHHFVTVFRNHLVGWEPGKTDQTTPIQLEAFSRYMNVVGNVLGLRGFHTQYENVAPSGTNSNRSIYTLGWSGHGGSTFAGVPNDPLTASTLMRWGNYDTVTASVRWVAAEVPSSLSQFANPIPATRTLPASFYLAARPSWWGSQPWPAVGPDVVGGDIAGVGGFAWRNPAQVCYANAAIDSRYGGNNVRQFNAARCYAPRSRPSAPTDIRVR